MEKPSNGTIEEAIKWVEDGIADTEDMFKENISDLLRDELTEQCTVFRWCLWALKGQNN